MGRLRVSSERLEKHEIELTTPGLEGEQPNHYSTEASISKTYIIPKRDQKQETLTRKWF